MGTSGLFERWRIIEAGAVTWFYDGSGGAYDYWPDGLSAPMRSQRPPFDNDALVADNDRMYHRIGWIGDQNTPAPSLSPAAQIDHDHSGHWTIEDRGRTVRTDPDGGFRFGFFTIPPDGGAGVPPDLDFTAALAEFEQKLPGLAEYLEPAEPGMHHRHHRLRHRAVRERHARTRQRSQGRTAPR